MGRENAGTALGSGIATSSSPKIWDFWNLNATPNVWHHVAMTYDGSTLLYFLDGISQASNGRNGYDRGEIIIKNTPVTIGQAGIGTGKEYFYGQIDEVRIYNRTLSKDEVKELYKIGQQ
jgi:hypothetical protein